jgi:DNA-binding NarL/FixJ family response regulator
VESNEIRIIIADNRASNRRGLKALLAFEPRIRIIGEADHGKEAIELVEAEKPDLVLMDIHMPVMDGLLATEKIKNIAPDTKVILYSIYPGYKNEARLAGADCFMIKGSPESTPAEIILSFFPPDKAVPA